MKGPIRVEGLTRDWQPIAGLTEREAWDIQGVALDHPVRYSNRAELAALAGQEIRLKFYMTRATPRDDPDACRAATGGGRKRIPLRSAGGLDAQAELTGKATPHPARPIKCAGA